MPKPLRLQGRRTANVSTHPISIKVVHNVPRHVAPVILESRVDHLEDLPLHAWLERVYCDTFRPFCLWRRDFHVYLHAPVTAYDFISCAFQALLCYFIVKTGPAIQGDPHLRVSLGHVPAPPCFGQLE